jgi:hypothetical protein
MSKSNPLSSKCTARSKRTGKPCDQWVVGGGVCWHHNGANARVRANREARIVALRAQLAGEPWEPRPAYEVLESAMADADAVLGRIKAQLGEGHIDAATLDALHRWVELAAKISKTILDADLDERRVRLAERQAALLVEALRLIFDDLDLDDRQRALVPVVVPRRLREIGGGEPS